MKLHKTITCLPQYSIRTSQLIERLRTQATYINGTEKYYKIQRHEASMSVYVCGRHIAKIDTERGAGIPAKCS